MDARRAVFEIRNNVSNYDLACDLVGLIEQQAQEIAKYQRRDASIINQICDEVDHANNANMEIMMLKTTVSRQQQEIAKKDRMIEAAVEQLRDYADEYTGRTAEQWLAWLEKEAEVTG